MEIGNGVNPVPDTPGQSKAFRRRLTEIMPGPLALEIVTNRFLVFGVPSNLNAHLLQCSMREAMSTLHYIGVPVIYRSPPYSPLLKIERMADGWNARRTCSPYPCGCRGRW